MKTLQKHLTIMFLIAMNALGYGQIDKDKSNYDAFIFRDDYPGYYDGASLKTSTVPSSKKLLFENSDIKISELYFQPGESISIHPLTRPSVICIKENDDFTDTAGATVFDTRTLTKPLIYPANFFKEPDTIHQITNLSPTKTLRLIRVETKE